MAYELGTISEIDNKTISIEWYLALKRDCENFNKRILSDRRMVFVYMAQNECGMIPEKDAGNFEKAIQILEKNEKLFERFENAVKKSGRYLVN